MRDSERIDRICTQLAEAWKQFPDMRFGQFICNLPALTGTKDLDTWRTEDEPPTQEVLDSPIGPWVNQRGPYWSEILARVPHVPEGFYDEPQK